MRCRTPTTSPPPEEPLLPAAPATLGALLRLANMQQPKLTCHIYHKNISGRHQGNKRLLAELDLESMQAKRRTFPSFVGAWCNLSVEMVSMQSGTGANVSLPLQISNGRAPAPDYLPRLATLRTEQFSRRRVSGIHIPQTSVCLLQYHALLPLTARNPRSCTECGGARAGRRLARVGERRAGSTGAPCALWVTRHPHRECGCHIPFRPEYVDCPHTDVFFC